MNCEQVKYQLIDFIDNNVSDAFMTKIQHHLNTCDACQDEYIQTGKLLKVISETDKQEPSVKLKTNFYKMLETEKSSLQDEPLKKTLKTAGFKHLNPFIKMAAQIVILISIGVIIGMQSRTMQKHPNEIQVLQTEIIKLKQNMNLVALKQPSASERIQAINSVNSNAYSNKIFEALISTMNTDENVNVRMASMYALAKYSNNENVRSSLIASLKFQADPLLQITLINILVNIQDARAKDPIYDLMNRKNTPDIVKKQAKSGLKAFV